MKFSFPRYFVFTAPLIGAGMLFGPSVDPAGTLGFSPSHAQVQPRLQNCREAALEGSLRGERILRCNDGRFFRRVGGRYIETDKNGNQIVREAPVETPVEDEVEEATLDPADPAFKKAPGPGDQQELDTSRSVFKKVPGS